MNYQDRYILEQYIPYNYKLGNFYFTVEYDEDEDDNIFIYQFDPIFSDVKIFSSSIKQFFFQFRHKYDDYIIELDRKNPNNGIWVKHFLPGNDFPVSKKFIKMFPEDVEEDKVLEIENPPFHNTIDNHFTFYNSSYTYYANIGGFVCSISFTNKLVVKPILKKIQCKNIIYNPYRLYFHYNNLINDTFIIELDWYGRGLYTKTLCGKDLMNAGGELIEFPHH